MQTASFISNPRDGVPVEFPIRKKVKKIDDLFYAFFVRPSEGRSAVVRYYDSYHHMDSLEREAANEVLHRLLDKSNPKGLDATAKDIYESARDLWKDKKEFHFRQKYAERRVAYDAYMEAGGREPYQPSPEKPFRFSIQAHERALLDRHYLEGIVELVKDEIIPFALEQGAVRIRDTSDMGWAFTEGMQFIGEAMCQGEKKAFYVPEGLLPESCKGTVERDVFELRSIIERFS